MKKLTLKQVRKIAMLMLAIGVTTGIIGAAMGGENVFFILGVVIIIASKVFHTKFYVCPYCGRYLDRNTGDYCPYCGRDVNKKY